MSHVLTVLIVYIRAKVVAAPYSQPTGRRQQAASSRTETRNVPRSDTEARSRNVFETVGSLQLNVLNTYMHYHYHSTRTERKHVLKSSAIGQRWDELGKR